MYSGASFLESPAPGVKWLCKNPSVGFYNTYSVVAREMAKEEFKSPKCKGWWRIKFILSEYKIKNKKMKMFLKDWCIDFKCFRLTVDVHVLNCQPIPSLGSQNVVKNMQFIRQQSTISR